MAWDRKAPFDKDGNLLHWASPTATQPWHFDYANTWEERGEFNATLRYLDYRRGRSAAYFLFEDVATEKQYPICMSDFCGRVLRELHNGVVTGRWLIAKHGQNFSLQRIGEMR